LPDDKQVPQYPSFLQRLTTEIPRVFKQPLMPSHLREGFLKAIFSAENIGAMIAFYDSLGDQTSRDTLIGIIINSLGCYLTDDVEAFSFISKGYWADLVKHARELPNLCDSYELDAVETFILEGYNYRNICRPKAGDIVLDCGAYTGNTALWFSQCIGATGKVYAFEAHPATYEKLSANIASLKLANALPRNFAICAKSGSVNISKNAVCSASILAKTNTIQVPAISIDEFVVQENLPKVDFIKMDIEGAEFEAIEGARKTIQRFTPTLAICIYHRDEDFVTIPAKIKEINPNYTFYIKHNSYNFWETVLFARQSPKSVITASGGESQALLALWEGLRLLHDKNGYPSKKLRKALLEAYATRVEALTEPRLTDGFMDLGTYMWQAWPLSPDRKLHFELFFVEDTVEISLHFEGKYSCHDAIIEEIIQASRLEIELKANKGPYKGCCYSVHEYENVEYVARLMAYLCKIALPILDKHNLLSDRFRLYSA